MLNILTIISFFWLVRTLKAVLFWIYLWQLKEYHIGRFLDHFRTHKGKKIFLNYLFLTKIILLPLLFLGLDIFLYVLLVIYILESLSLLKGFKKPVFTLKTATLTLLSTLVVICYISEFWRNASYLLAFDIATPLIVSVAVLLIQPFFVLLRNRILKKAKQKMASFKNLKVIGITGSYGKTSTKEFLATILSSKFKVLSTKEHKNSEMGIAQTILKELMPEHRVFIVEMGAYKKGGIKLLCNMVKPEVGMVAGVNEQHLATFGSMENILSAEGGGELLDSLPKDGLLVVNGDNKYCLELYKKANINKKIYSLKGDRVYSDIFADQITIQEFSVDFLAITKEKVTTHFNVGVLGKQNVQNLLGAILVARELGMSLEAIAEAAKNIKPEQAGMTLKKGVHGINVIDSSYSSNPDGVMADLDYLNVFSGKKIVVMPCLIELGKKSSEIHQQIGKKIAEICDMAIITTRDKFEEIKKSAMREGMAEKKVIFSERPKEIFNLITTNCSSGDAILLEGRVTNEVIKLLKL